jgi:hypothetical protein
MTAVMAEMNDLLFVFMLDEFCTEMIMELEDYRSWRQYRAAGLRCD